MTTSKITRNYWIDKAKGWGEAKLSPPQADEFNAAMDELISEREAAQKEIERLQSELKAANDDADRLANELEETYAHNDICWEEPGESSLALIAHKNRMEQTNG